MLPADDSSNIFEHGKDTLVHINVILADADLKDYSFIGEKAISDISSIVIDRVNRL